MHLDLQLSWLVNSPLGVFFFYFGKQLQFGDLEFPEKTIFSQMLYKIEMTSPIINPPYLG